ncbi:lactonase family protein [Pandoraea sputorum]|uniref:6-phosphogluconolactonase n=1 Tax=Pandoraea sputorum TaxID=93222 RepID=A0A5E5APU8_9BURK|nr:beta-propeller fold lactonase family protein [Pandoraea sputorum]VVE75749.1 6-phosphogluconolactonase [Pandoraea sputorum]
MKSFAYAISFSGGVNAYAVQSNGELKHIGVPVTDESYSIAAYRDKVFVGGYRHISVFSVAPDGTLVPLIKNYDLGPGSPITSIAVTTAPGSDNCFVYTNDGQVHAFFFIDQINKIERIDLGRYQGPKGYVSEIRVDPVGRFLYATMFGGQADLGVFMINTFGQLAFRSGARLPFVGNTIIGPDISNRDPERRFTYVGTIIDNSVHGYRVNVGELSPLDWAGYDLPGSPSAIQMSPDGAYLFLSTAADRFGGENLVISFAVDNSDGSLTQVNSQPCDEETTAFAMALGGKYLYATSYTEKKIYCFQVKDGGALARVSPTTTPDFNDAIVTVNLA